MCALMDHENEDVGLAVLDLLAELMDTELIEEEEDEKHLGCLGEAFLEQGGLEFMAGCLNKLELDCAERIKGADDVLSLLECLLEMEAMELLPNHSVIENVTPYLPWLFNHLSSPPESLHLHTSIIVSTVLHHAHSQKHLELTQIPETDAMECMLQAIAPYRKSNPKTTESKEYLENALQALSASMLNPRNVPSFLNHQGVELMLRCLKETTHAGRGALQVLHFALSSSEARKTSHAFLHAGGLKLLFPLLMGRLLPKPAFPTTARGKRAWVRDVEGNVINVLYSLTLAFDEKHDARDRLLAKFLEKDCEKCDRLLDLLLDYDDRARRAESKYHRSDEADGLDDQDADLAALHAKLKGGGDAFHRLGAVAAFVCAGSRRCHAHVIDQLALKNSGIGLVRAALEEFFLLLDDGPQKDRLDAYVAAV